MSKESIPPLPELTPEEEIRVLLKTLPEELRKRWEEANESAPIEMQVENIREYVRKRTAAIAERPSLNALGRPSHVTVERAYPQAIANIIEKLELGEHVQLGFGRAGRVVASVSDPDICYKVLYPKDKLPLETNPISVEADIQDEIASMGEIDGVRAPRVFMFVEHDSVQAIRMERLEADSLDDLLNGRAEWPPSFNCERFFSSLQTFLEHMHANDYYHRDLHLGNVMVDRSTGNPRVIDFGAAARKYLDDDIYRKQVYVAGRSKDIVLLSDLDQIRAMKARTAEALRRGV